jgi:hypothetical protein
MFVEDEIYGQPVVAKKAKRSTQRIRDWWKKEDLLPPPDMLLGGKIPAWWGSTLNNAKAFAKPNDDRNDSALPARVKTGKTKGRFKKTATAA